jgi:predicted TIM-barrel fold metal-dependent hydrolase
MPIIDSQVHAYERNHPGRPWHAVLHGPPEVTGADMVKAMDAVGVDGAILVSAFTMYRFDASYAVSVRNTYPDRFALIKPVDPNDPAVAETIADWQATPGAVAIRIMMRGDVSADPADPGINHVLATAAKRDLPVNLLCWGRLDQVHELARRNPNTRLVIDHLGLQQPFEPPRMDNGFDELPKLLALAAFPNIVVKISGACTLSRGEYPYADIWESLARIFDAFGMQRCLWGTDWTRAVELMTYAEGVDAFLKSDRLSDTDRAMLMYEATSRAYRWAPGGK